MSDEDKTAEYDKYKAQPLQDYESQSAYQRDMDSIRERLRKAEDWALTMKHHGDQIDTLMERVHELNNKLEAFFEYDDEVARKDRWHETYNHSRPSAYRNTSDTEEEYRANVERCHLAAVDAADRAHGPLNQVTLRPGAFDQTAALRGAKLENPPVNEGPFIQSLKFVDSREMYTMYKRGDVDALVQAAADAHAYMGTFHETATLVLVFGALTRALKPFNRSE